MKNKILIFLILALAFALRFWRLDTTPALNADEAAIGYNAYSLLQTGLDEHGNSWPIHFQSFNDYKPGLYFYLVLPFVEVLGLNEWAVRIPNALLGVATVYLIFLLSRKLFTTHNLLPLAASFLLAISPWHIHYSRGGWEVNTATFFVVFGVYMFLKFINDRKFLKLGLSIVAFVLSMYTYHSARIISPLLGLGLIAVYWKDLNFRKNLRPYVLSFVFLILLLMPLVRDLMSSGALSRAAGVGLSADIGPINRINEQRGEHLDQNPIFAKILHNKFVNYGLAFGKNYLSHFSGEFLFMTGDSIQRNKVPETGEMYLFDILLLFVGFVYVFKNFTRKRAGYQLVLLWLIIAPLASALTFQSPNALRSEMMIIPLTIISGIGLVVSIDFLKNKNLIAVIGLLGLLIVWSLARYIYMYYNFMAKEYPFSSQYGVKEMVAYVNENKNKYKDVVITDRYDQPYILYLFYTKYDPAKFQADHILGGRDNYGFSTVRDFDNLHFYSIKYDEMRILYPNSLIVGTPEEIPDEANIVKKIYGTNGYNYFDVVAN